MVEKFLATGAEQVVVFCLACGEFQDGDDDVVFDEVQEEARIA